MPISQVPALTLHPGVGPSNPSDQTVVAAWTGGRKTDTSQNAASRHARPPRRERDGIAASPGVREWQGVGFPPRCVDRAKVFVVMVPQNSPDAPAFGGSGHHIRREVAGSGNAVFGAVWTVSRDIRMGSAPDDTGPDPFHPGTSAGADGVGEARRGEVSGRAGMVATTAPQQPAGSSPGAPAAGLKASRPSPAGHGRGTGPPPGSGNAPGASRRCDAGATRRSGGRS